MNRTLIIIVFLFGLGILCSCGIKWRTPTSGIHKVEYEGHTYLMRSEPGGYGGICHDENCNCKK